MKEQWLHPKTTNEEATKNIFLRLLKPAFEIIKSRIQRGTIEIFGGAENANSLVTLTESSEFKKKEAVTKRRTK
ncbi:hypothetical protein FOWG_17224 [Fusarium oxysporum f. sp. lycopersici MN25]|nr:hypothetical protein FOWG_17224 [Fusarium oxysporum f. sp. lycopersici MN25]